MCLTKPKLATLKLIYQEKIIVLTSFTENLNDIIVMDGEDTDEDANNDQQEIDLDELEEELDLHVPMIRDIDSDDNENDDDDGRMVPNGYHDDDEEVVEDSDSDNNINDEEVPHQPRIMLGNILAELGQHRVDDSDNDVDDDHAEDDEDQEAREVYIQVLELPARHAYLGDGRQVGGRTILDDDDVISLPLLNQPGLALVPGQLLPLHIFHPAMISMIM